MKQKGISSFLQQKSAKKLKLDNIKIMSWNVASLNAVIKKDFKAIVEKYSPQILVIQETKLNADVAPLIPSMFPYVYNNFCTKRKGYSGTLLASTVKPISVVYDLKNNLEFDREARVITAEFASFYLVSCYIPNAGQKLDRLAPKIEYMKLLKQHILNLQKTKTVVWCGDLNVAHMDIDIARPDQNQKSAGFTKEERESFSDMMEKWFV